jgi:hypothetical protein
LFLFSLPIISNHNYILKEHFKKETHPVLDKSHSFSLILYYWYIKLIVSIKEKSFYSGESFMWNKKRILTLSVMLIIIVLFILTKVVATSSTTAIVTVLKKNYVEEQEEAFMIVIPPGGDQSSEYWKDAKTKIHIKDPMVWNLIEEDQTYLVHYDNKQSGVRILTHVENIDDKHAIQLQ